MVGQTSSLCCTCFTRQIHCLCVTGFPWPVPGLPIVFLACAGQERRTALNSSNTAGTAGTAGTSYQNDEEAAVVLKVLQQLLSGSDALQAKDIGVITPYTGQVTQHSPLCSCCLDRGCFRQSLQNSHPHLHPDGVCQTTLVSKAWTRKTQRLRCQES